MLFGQSIFQSVLDRLAAEEAELPTQSVASHHIQGLNTSFVADVRDGVSAASARPGEAYFDNLEPNPEPARINTPRPQATPAPTADVPPEERAAPPVMPAHLAHTSPQAVALELAVSTKDTLQTLSEKRRAFARVNHPDGVDPLFRDKATARMKIANLLIDEAIRRVELRAKLFG